MSNTLVLRKVSNEQKKFLKQKAKAQKPSVSVNTMLLMIVEKERRKWETVKNKIQNNQPTIMKTTK